MFESKISEALFTKTQQRVLGILYGKPDQSFYLNEIVRLAAVGKGSVKRELDKLEDAGLIVANRRGNQRHFQADHENHVYKELKGLIRKTLCVVDIIKEGLEPLVDDLEQAFIFGDIGESAGYFENEVDLVLISDRLTYGQVKPMVIYVQQETGRRIKPHILSKREYGERITKPQSFIGWVMDQPKLWLLEQRSL